MLIFFYFLFFFFIHIVEMRLHNDFGG